MTFDEAMSAMAEGKWVRLRWMAEEDDLWFFAAHESLPEHWIDGLEWSSEYYSLHIDGTITQDFLGAFVSGIGGADFSEEERASDEWELFDPTD